MERLFAHFKSDKSVSVSSYDPKNSESYEQYLQSMMEDAVDYETSVLAGDRSTAQLLFYGLSPSLDHTNASDPFIGEDPTATLGELLNKDDKNSPNRSTYVSTDVRDAIMLMLPSLIRLFGATESPVYLVPRSQKEVATAKAGTEYVNYVFWKDNPGFLILYGACKDALTVKTGFVKWWTENNKEIRRKRWENVTKERLQFIKSEDPSAEIIEIGNPVPGQTPLPPQTGAPQVPPLVGPSAVPGSSPLPVGGQPAGPMAGAPAPLPASLTQEPPEVYDYAIVEFRVSKPLIKVSGVPPEEMRLDRYARTFRESRIVGHERVVPVDQLVEMGVDRDLCLGNITSSESNNFTVEPQLRNPGRFMGSSVADGCLFGEWYVKIDKDGDDIPELRYICTIGDKREIILDEDANRIKFALFSCDPVGHTIVGDSLADYTKDIQLIKTNIMRAILDSAAESINPKTVINELMVNIDDAMNDDLGAVVRSKGNVNDSVAFFNTPFLGQAAMPVVDMLNDQLSRRTGMTDASKGLDPKALQSSTQIGVEAVINGAQERIELVARVLAETGFKDLFEGLYNEICENPNQRRSLQINGEWTEYDTSTFDESMSVEVNENLGKGSDLTRMITLQGIKQDQQLIVTQMGLNNPICGPIEMLNTQRDMLKLANVMDFGRYFRTPTPEQMQQMLSAPAKPNALDVAAQAQLEKVRSGSAIALAEQQFNAQKLQAETSFKREQMHTKTAVDLQKISVDAAKAGVDQHVQLATLASQLRRDQSDRDAADQDAQIKSAQAQNEQDAGQLQARQAEHDMQMKAAAMVAQHIQKQSSTAAQHTQAMTDMAARHHQAMTGHAVKGAQAVVGAMTGDADRAASAQENLFGRQHQSRESSLDRKHQAKTAVKKRRGA